MLPRGELGSVCPGRCTEAAPQVHVPFHVPPSQSDSQIVLTAHGRVEEFLLAVGTTPGPGYKPLLPRWPHSLWWPSLEHLGQVAARALAGRVQACLAES